MMARHRATNAMFLIELRKAEQIRRYSISPPGLQGWEVTLEREGETRHVFYTDWHRVERAMTMVKLEVSELTEHGWHEVPPRRPPS
jgi:hypothetical protein